MKKILLILTIIITSFSIISCDNKEEINEVINLIDNLPEVITLSDEENINIILEKYNDLSKKEQSKVTNYNVFLNKKADLEKLKNDFLNQEKVENVIQLINELPNLNDLTLEDKQQVLNTFNEYNNLDDTLKSLITNIDKLNELLTVVNKFESIENVLNSINNLPEIEELTYEDKSMLTEIRLAYDALDETSKKYVGNKVDVLVLYEEKMNELIEQNENLLIVIDLINSLPTLEELTISHEKQIISARKAYDSLPSLSKDKVSNISKLEDLEAKLNDIKLEETYKNNAQKVIDLIKKLPADITIEHENLINECFEKYNSLLPIEQKYVSNYNDLVSKKEKLEEIIANTIYNVEVKLDGGYLDNMIEIEQNEKISELLIKNYSCNIWTEYTNTIFIYKTSLMKLEDKFTSFLKVGIKTDSNNYVAVQKIEVGTPLDENLRTSDYYILVHPDNSVGYANVNKIDLNYQITIDKSLPDSSTDSLNANVSVFSKSATSKYYIEVKGMSTLPVPSKAGYKFMGWYLDSSFKEGVTYVSSETVVYAKWIVDKGEITTETVLNLVSDIAESDTIDELLLENNDATFTWSSSNNKLYNINNGLGTVSKRYQTHKKQYVTITVEIKYKTGSVKTLSKEITINPVKFNDFSSTPIATYFYTGAISAYKKYNERYIANQTLFSETTKETLDIVYYAFIVPNDDGSVYFQNEAYLEEVKELKNHNVRILGCVNGVGSDTSQAFKTITASATLRKTFINNLMNLVEKHNLDGLDLDWEAVSSSLKPVASQYNKLCEELRAEMTLRQDEGGSPYLLTMAVPASSYGTATDRFDFVTLNKYVDYINIMSYDLNDTAKATHLSPLYTSTKDNGYGFGAVYGVNRISSLGFDKNKLIIGCAGYGKAYKVSSGIGTYPTLGTSATLTQISGYDGSFKSGTVYGSTINQLIKTGRYKQYTEVSSNGKVVGSYLYSATDNIFITFDSKEAVMAKYEYAKSIGVGMMCWAYTEDTSDTVINAIYEAKNQ